MRYSIALETDAGPFFAGFRVLELIFLGRTDLLLGTKTFSLGTKDIFLGRKSSSLGRKNIFLRTKTFSLGTKPSFLRTKRFSLGRKNRFVRPGMVFLGRKSCVPGGKAGESGWILVSTRPRRRHCGTSHRPARVLGRFNSMGRDAHNAKTQRGRAATKGARNSFRFGGAAGQNRSGSFQC